MRNFSTGATRDSDENKFDYEGFLNPLVVERFAAYMHKHRFQADGKIRDSDNWQKGMPKDAYMKSMFRHFMDVWKNHRGIPSEDLEESLAALMFNVMGYLYETLKDKANYIDNGGVDSSAFEPVHTIAIADVIRDYTDDPAFAYEEENNHYTHRYGALAHDQESIEDEEDEGLVTNRNQVFDKDTPIYISIDAEGACGIVHVNSTGYFRNNEEQAIYNPKQDASVSSLPGLVNSEVLRVPTERASSEVATVASQVRGVEPGEASFPIVGCKW